MKEIILNTGESCQVSDEDYEYLNQWAWCINKNGEVNRNTRNGHIYLATVVADRALILHPNELDHEDRNKLNNQRQNLRGATKSENGANQTLSRGNTSGYKGVSLHSRKQKWIAQIKVRQQTIYLGMFAIAEDAAKAYDKAARQYFGKFANTNFKE